MEILTGHGIFNYYRYRICKESHTSSWECGEDQDDAEHVLFICLRWPVERAALETDSGTEMKIDNDVIKKVASDNELW